MHRCVFAPATPAAIVKAAVARSNVIVYAVVDTCVSHNNDGKLTEEPCNVESGQQFCSRIDFKVRTEFSAATSASYGFKKGIDADTGAFAQTHSSSPRLYGRQTWDGHGACYLYRPMSVQFAYHKANGMTGPGALSDAPGKECAGFISSTYNFGGNDAHVVYADKKLQTINDDSKDRNDLVDMAAPAGAAGKVLAAETRNEARYISSGYVDQHAIGYTYLLPVCTNLYTLHSYPRNEDGAVLATCNNSMHAANVEHLNLGMRHMF